MVVIELLSAANSRSVSCLPSKRPFFVFERFWALSQTIRTASVTGAGRGDPHREERAA